MKKLFALLVFLPLFCMGQKQNYIWYFGNGAGLNFNTGCDPSVLTNGNIEGFEGCATICNKETGSLLFYTNSDSVWNRNNVVMPNGHLVSNGSTITQVLIIQKPNSNDIYYIITLEIQGFSGEGIRCHEVDMSLNGGLGGFTSKDMLVYPSPVTEKITAIRHANGTDIWLITHEHKSDRFLAFLVTPSGINTTPVVTEIGKVYTANSIDAIGEMKASPDGTMIAAVTFYSPNIELLRFSKSTGRLAKLITLPENGGFDSLGTPSGLYGVSFSSNSSMLYVTKNNLPSSNSPGQVIQFNVTAGDSATINNSRVDVFTTTSKSLYSLQLAPNRKIYVGQYEKDYLGVINSPDSAGTNCNYQDDGLYLNGKRSSWGLNNLMEYNNYCDNPGTTEIDDISRRDMSIELFPNPFSTITTLKINRPLKKASFILYNSIGQQVKYIGNIKGQMITINRDHLSTGMYYFQLTEDGRTCATGKLVVAD